MHSTTRFQQARARSRPLHSVRQNARRFVAVMGEVLALGSLVLALVTGLATLTSMLG